MNKILYFAYGSNMNLQQMKERCPHSEKLGIGYMEDAEVYFPSFYEPWDSGMAGYKKSPGNIMWGVLFELDHRDLEVMRDYEDYVPGRDSKENNYEEVFVDIFFKDKFVKCMTYESCITGTYKPSPAYLKTIVDGAVDNNLPADYIEKLSKLL